MSVDGFIADKNGSVSFLDDFTGNDYGYEKFVDDIDIVVMGRVTYEQILRFGEFPYKTKKCYVFSNDSKNKNRKDEYAEFVDINATEFAKKYSSNDQKVWLVGGGRLIREFLQEYLVDELILFKMPVLLGKGVKLFDDVNINSKNLKLIDLEKYENSTIKEHYIVL